jgi:hypothetical protein
MMSESQDAMDGTICVVWIYKAFIGFVTVFLCAFAVDFSISLRLCGDIFMRTGEQDGGLSVL